MHPFAATALTESVPLPSERPRPLQTSAGVPACASHVARFAHGNGHKRQVEATRPSLHGALPFWDETRPGEPFLTRGPLCRNPGAQAVSRWQSAGAISRLVFACPPLGRGATGVRTRLASSCLAYLAPAPILLTRSCAHSRGTDVGFNDASTDPVHGPTMCRRRGCATMREERRRTSAWCH
jgi:hypothetical protein